MSICPRTRNKQPRLQGTQAAREPHQNTRSLQPRSHMYNCPHALVFWIEMERKQPDSRFRSIKSKPAIYFAVQASRVWLESYFQAPNPGLILQIPPPHASDRDPTWFSAKKRLVRRSASRYSFIIQWYLSFDPPTRGRGSC